MAVVYLRFDVNENYFKFVVKESISFSQTLSCGKEQSLPPASALQVRLLFVERQETLGKGYLFDLLTSKKACH